MGGSGEKAGAISAVLSRSGRGEEVRAGSSQNVGASEGSRRHCGETARKQSRRRKSKQGRKHFESRECEWQLQQPGGEETKAGEKTSFGAEVRQGYTKAAS